MPLALPPSSCSVSPLLDGMSTKVQHLVGGVIGKRRVVTEGDVALLGTRTRTNIPAKIVLLAVFREEAQNIALVLNEDTHAVAIVEGDIEQTDVHLGLDVILTLGRSNCPQDKEVEGTEKHCFHGRGVYVVLCRTQYHVYRIL